MTTSHPDTLRLARLLRGVSAFLDTGVVLVVAGSVIAIGAVHPWAYVPLWITAACLVALVALRAALVKALRRRLGGGVINSHFSGQWVSAAGAGERDDGWRFDLDRPLLGSVPLLAPGLAFVALILLQLVPIPAEARSLLAPTHPLREGWAPITLSPAATVRGLAFVCALLGVHVAAGSAFTRGAARDRFARILAILVLVLGLAALAQNNSGLLRIYGVFAPQERGAIFGTFVNRNHFATWMAMATAVALGLLHARWLRYVRRLGERPNLRRRLSALQTREGTHVVFTMVCVFMGIAALLASSSRGGILAFVAALVLAVVGARRSDGVTVSVLAAVFLAISATWFGLDRLGLRFEALADDSPTRAAVWMDSFRRLHGGEWVVGAGFNTFALKMSRAAPFLLPAGAAQWPVEVAALAGQGAHVALRTLESAPGMVWYREAHSEYVQAVAETGLAGLAIVLWAIARTLARARLEPWRFAALTAGLLHAAVDFPFQIPAVAVLFVVVAAARVGHREAAEGR